MLSLNHLAVNDVPGRGIHRFSPEWGNTRYWKQGWSKSILVNYKANNNSDNQLVPVQASQIQERNPQRLTELVEYGPHSPGIWNWHRIENLSYLNLSYLGQASI